MLVYFALAHHFIPLHHGYENPMTEQFPVWKGITQSSPLPDRKDEIVLVWTAVDGCWCYWVKIGVCGCMKDRER